MKRVLAIVSLVVASMPCLSWDGTDPLGEKALYKIDSPSDRTSRVIRSGVVNTEVTGHLDDDQAYEITIDYDIKIMLLGPRQGQEKAALPDDYFNPLFMENLRKTGFYETEDFKIEHLGYRDAINLDGLRYDHCDYIHIYDINTESSFASYLMSTFLKEEVRDAEVWAHITDLVPVIGAAKVDVKGNVDGRDIVAGADYIAP